MILITKKIILALLITSVSFQSIAQVTERDEKNEIIEEQVYDLVTDSETLRALSENKELILDDSESDWDIIKSIPKDAWALVKAPAGWSKREWIIAGGVVTMTTLLMTGDHLVKDFFQRNKTEFTKDVSFLAEKADQVHAGIAATYVLGTILKNKKLKKASVLAFTSLLISTALVQGLKYTFGRTRPYAASNQYEFTGPGFHSKDRVSFPSGHTAAAFAVAASIATVYDSKLVQILAYSAATLTGLSRIHDNKHWVSDVFMGAVLGTVTGIFVTKRHMNSRYNGILEMNPTSLTVGGQTGYGVSLKIQLGTGRSKKRKEEKRLKRLKELGY
jgi:hypothetical protein